MNNISQVLTTQQIFCLKAGAIGGLLCLLTVGEQPVWGQANERPAVRSAVPASATVEKEAPAKSKQADQNAGGRPESLGSLTPEREAAALKFVELHHPELLELLSALKRGNRPQYRVALQDIFRVSERLARSNDRQPERYEQELQLWKVNSRLTLLMASLPMADDVPETLAQIRELMQQRYQLETAMIAAEVQTVQQRLERLEKNLTRRQEQQQDAIDRQMERLTRHYADPSAPDSAAKVDSREEVKKSAPGKK